MEWSNEKALEFLELLQSEPCLWNPQVQSHKNRSAINDAWRRIIQCLSFPVTLEELKKKKDSLMGYYRIHLNKYKKSLKSGAGQNEVYTTNWFAFELMDSFLRPIYGTKSVINTESSEENSTDKTTNESAEEVSQNRSNTRPTTSTGEHESTSVSANQSSPSVSQNDEKFKRPYVQNQKSKTPSEIVHAKKQMDEAFERLRSVTSQKREQLDEYDHFALMIASKIRKLENPDDREILMNSIHNLTFEFYMKNKKSFTTAQSATQSLSSSSAQSSPMYQYQHSDEENTNTPQMQLYSRTYNQLPQESSTFSSTYNQLPQESSTLSRTYGQLPQESSTLSTTYNQLTRESSTLSNETSQRILSISESGSVRISDNNIIYSANLS